MPFVLSSDDDALPNSKDDNCSNGSMHELLPQTKLKPFDLLPFPCLKQSWYEHQGVIMQADSARKNRRASNPLHVQSEGIMSMNRTNVSGTL